MKIKLQSWITGALVRNFPHSPVGRNCRTPLDAVRLGRCSFQIAMRLDDQVVNPVKVQCELEVPSGWRARIRRVGFVPVAHQNTETPPCEIDGADHYPGFVPDPLFDETTLTLPPRETHSFYLTVISDRNTPAGLYNLVVTIADYNGDVLKKHQIKIKVHDVTLQPRRGFAVTNWFYADALIDWYNTDLFDERFFELAAAYFRNMVEHGQDTIYVPVFTPPLDGIKRPTQLLHVNKTGDDCYQFDWRDVRRYIRLARKCGFKKFEWSHLFSQWGCENAIRVYQGQGANGTLLWPPESGATSPVYYKFLSQFLPELKRFCAEEKILRHSFFHLSDEPHSEQARVNYVKARAMIRELAPWMRVMDALSDIAYGRESLTDMPIPSITVALDFIKEKIPCWCYFCCYPRGAFLNRLMDTPLPKIAMSGWLFYRWPFQGFLHWGYNYWYRRQSNNLIDPFSVQDAHAWPQWAYGDPFLVYPGPDGPIDSLRYEAFADSLQDYALLQTLGVLPQSKMLSPLQSFAAFPKTAQWLTTIRRKLLRQYGRKLLTPR